MKAYMSLTRLYNDHLSESKAKIAALWFDEVMIYSFSKSFFPEYLMEVYGISKGHENLLRSIFTDINDDALSHNRGKEILYNRSGDFVSKVYFWIKLLIY